jgi:hypothetical protein
MTQAERDARWLQKHKPQHAFQQKEWRDQPHIKERLRNKKLQDKYDIDIPIYEEMLAINKGRCWICNRLPTTVRLSVDHEHASGQVRGLLCYLCNKRLIGRAKRADSYKYLAAFIYLENQKDWRKGE